MLCEIITYEYDEHEKWVINIGYGLA